MSERVKKALEKHKAGYNCAQCVACTFSDEVGVDEDFLFRATEGLGAGMGSTKATCGAVAGAGVVFGMKNSTGKDLLGSKAATCRLSRELVKQFEEKNGTIICENLKGVKTKKVLRSCEGCIEDAVEITEKILKSLENE